MLFKTLGIILSNVKFGDKKVISKIYTLDFGLQSYVINFGSSSKSKIKAAHLQALNQVELEIFAKEKNDINRVNEIRVNFPYREINFHPLKSCVAVFLNELIIKTFKESQSNPELFYFVSQSFQFLDEEKVNFSSFHLYFMVTLTVHLGFFPINNFDEDHTYFNLIDGRFERNMPQHPNFFEKNDSKEFSILISCFEKYKNSSANISATQRNTQLKLIIHYYLFHSPGFTEFKSLPVLQATLHG